MRRLSAWLIGPLALATLGVAAGPAGAKTPKPLVVKAEYTVTANYNYKPQTQVFSLTLYTNHTGTDHWNDTITWSVDASKNITLVLDGGFWTYKGVMRANGISTAKKPGSLTNMNGGYGTWWAVKNPPA